MKDLFGNDHPEPAASKSPAIPLSLFAHAAERRAIDSGRPLSQELGELVNPNAGCELAEWFETRYDT
jgi:hypothetical protein